jgi:hypothetical protein
VLGREWDCPNSARISPDVAPKTPPSALNNTKIAMPARRYLDVSTARPAPRPKAITAMAAMKRTNAMAPAKYAATRAPLFAPRHTKVPRPASDVPELLTSGAISGVWGANGFNDISRSQKVVRG